MLGPEAEVRLINNYTPIVQSVSARAYERTSVLLGEELAPDASVQVLRRAQTMAREVVGINDTTRANLVKTIETSIKEGMTPRETVKAIRAEVPEIKAARLPTIVRTEVGRAIDQGTIQSFKESTVVATVDVVGCQAREPGSPQYNGQSTCNAVGIPVYDLDKIRFHPNHGGAIVAGTFHE